ncbi:ESPR-type extended signal peptide-containing protein [Mitsuokella multacida]|uniref:ESPR-type extended signal peptide-containing protein n=1 Tax=Mitsuokella multacida TaxID=52226 RepID=UPI0026602FEC|nr:ESPR-type extended signal peptide-containing protein [Mitsuokella multacida]
MNRVYKVIYNRARNLYQVVSEIVHSRGKTKSLTAQHQHERLTTAILIALFAMGTSLPVGWAADTNGANDTTTDTTTVKDAKVDASNLSDDNKTAWRNALGVGTITSGTYTTDDTTVAGNLSKLDTQVNKLDTQVKKNAGDLSTLSNTVSTNNTDLNTKITSITSDITSLEDLSNITPAGKKVITGLSTKITQGDRVTVTPARDVTTGQMTYTISVNNDGKIESGNTNLVSGGTMYTELRPTSGKYISAGQSTAANLISLDQNLLNVVNALGLDADDTTKSYTSKLNKYFKVNPKSTTTDGTTDAAANGTNSVAIGPSAQAGEKTTDAPTAATTGIGGTSSTAIGDSAKANGDQSVALGYGSEVLNASGSTKAVSGSTAIGSGAKVEGGSDSTALGSGATVDTASNAMALGKNATINKTATSGVAIGNGAVTGSADKTITVNNLSYDVKAAGGVDSVAIGTDASSAGSTSIALGKGATVENDSDGSYQAVVKSDDIAVGTGAKTTASDASTAIGKGAFVSQSTDALAIGSRAAVGASSNDAMALGKEATVGSGAADSIAMGTKAKTISADTIAIGQNASATGANSVVIGKEATTTSEGGNAIGLSSTASGNSTAIGQSATANNYNAVAIGNGATANADKSIALGYNAGVGTSEGKGEPQNAGSLIAIGTSAGNNVLGMQNVAIGESAGSNVKSSFNVAIGSQAGYGINYASDNKSQNGYNVSIGYKANYQENSADIMYSTALGNEANASNYAVAIGDEAKASGTNSLALGYSAQASDAESMALGHNASAADGNVAIGNGSLAPSVSTLGTVKAVTVDGKTINYVYDANNNQFKSAFTDKPLQADSHYISVGNSTLTRRISNVADGVFASDAATVGQLNSLNELLQATDTKVGLTKDYFEQKFTNLNTTIDASKTHYFSISESSDNLSANKDNTGATSNKADAMAIGPNANATNVKSLAVGNNVYATGLRSIAIGTAPNPTKDTAGTTTTHNTSAEGENSIALGTSTTAQADNSVAIGTRAQAYTTDTDSGKTGARSVAIGNLATTAGDESVALGYQATVKYNYGTAIGKESLASGVDAVAIGKGSKAYSKDSMAIGQDNSIIGDNVYGLGSSNNFSGDWGAIIQSGVSGYNNTVTSVSDQDTTNALTGIYMTGNTNDLNQQNKYNVMQDITVQGTNNKIYGGSNISAGHPNTLSQIAIVGSGNNVQGKSDDDGRTNNIENVTILGYNNKVDANTDTTVDFSNTQILGNKVTATLGNSVYLGDRAAYVQPTSPASDAITAARTAADTAAEASDEYKAAATDEAKVQIKAEYEAKYLYKLRVQAMEGNGTTAGMNSYDTDETYGNGTSYTYAGSNPTGVITVGSVGSERRIQNVAAGLVSATSTDAVNGSQLYALTRQIRFGGDNSSFGTTTADDKNVVARGSNETIAITGGSDAVTASTTNGNTTYIVDATKLTDNNIAVVADTDKETLHVQLASSLKDLNTAQLGSGSGDSYKETVKLDGTGANGGQMTLAGTDGTVKTTLDTTGLTIANGPKFTSSGIDAGSQKINHVTAGTDDADAVNVKQLQSARTLLTQGTNTTLADTDADGHHTYTVNVDNLAVKANGTGTTVALANGINFKNGTNTMATVGADGTVTISASHNKLSTVSAATGDKDNVTLTLTDVDGNTVTSTGLKNTYTTVNKNGTNHTVTFARNDGTTETLSLGDLDGASKNELATAAAKATSEVTNGTNVTSVTKTTGNNNQNIYTVNVDDLAVKTTDGEKKSVHLKDGLVFADGTNTTATVGDNGTIKFNVSDNAIKKQAVDAINVTGGSNVTVTPVTNADGTVKTFTIAASDLKYSAGGTSRTTNLANGISFAAGANTTAEIGTDGAVKINATHNKLNAAGTATKATADSNAVTLTLNDADGNTTTTALTDTYTTIFKDGTNKKVTFKRNDGETQTLELSDLGGITAAQDKYVTGGTVSYDNNGNGTASLTGNNGLTASITGLKDTKVSYGTASYGGTQENAAAGTATLTMNDGTKATISGLKDDYITSASVGTETNHVTMTRLGGGTVDLNLNPILEKYSLSDYHLVGDGTTHDRAYAVDSNGTVTLNVVDDKNPNGTPKTIQITGLASQSGVNAGRTTVKSSDSSVTVSDSTANSDIHTYDIKVDYSKIPANLTVRYSGDNGTSGSNTMDKTTAFSGTANQIVTTAADGKVSFKLADDISGIQSVTTGDAKLNTNGLTVTNGPTFTKSNIDANNQQIHKVLAGTENTDAANVSQVKAATTEVKAGTNTTIDAPTKDSTDNHQVYTVNVDNLALSQNDAKVGTGVALKNGLNFKDGTNTTASVTADGKVSFSISNDAIKVQAKNAVVLTAGDNVTIGTPTDVDNVKTYTVSVNDLKLQADGADKATRKLADGINFTGGTNTTADVTADGKVTYNLKDSISLTQVQTGNTTLNTTGVSSGDMSLTNTGFVIKNNDTSKQVSVTTSGVSMGSQRIQNVANAEVDTDAATLKQVKNARTVVAGGSNVAGVTPAEGANNQMTYTVNVDNLSVKANSEEAKSVMLKNGLTFKDGTNTTASVGEEGVVSFGLKPEISLTKVTTGNTTMDTNGLAISGGPTIAAGGINAGGKTITGVANGVGDNDAVNISQLKAVQSDINAGWTIKGKDTANADVSANIGKGKSVTYSNGNYTKAVITKDDSGNAAVTVDVTTGTLTTGTDGKITSADGLATTGDVASAVNGASWTIQDGNHTDNAQQVKAGDTVSLKAGDNLSLEQNGKEFTYKLNQTLTNMNSVTAVDDKQNTAVLNGEGLKVTDAQGNALTQHATEVRLHDANKAADDTTTDVVLNKQGLQNGGHTITGVADGTVDASSQDAVNGSQLYALQQKVTNGWKITGDDTTKASNIGNDKTVSFVNGDNSYIKSKVNTTNTGATVSYTAQTASLTNTDGKAALTGTMDGLVTGRNLTSVLNNLSWTAQSSKVGSGQNSGSTSQSIAAGSKVSFIAGDNMILTQDGTNFTYALNSSLTGMNTIAFTGLGNGASNLTIGLQNGGGANPDKGYYITGLSNTKWDQSNYEGTRAATEAQLREAIDKVSAATGTGGFGLTADEGANNGGEKKVSQTLGRTIAIQGDGTYGADGTVVKQGNISTVAYTDNAGPTGAIKVKLNKDVDLSEAGSLTIGASKVSAGSIVLDNTGDAAKKIALNSTAGTASIGGVTVNGAAKTVMGLANTTWDGTAVSGRAATEDQLAKAISDVSEQATNSELHIRKGTYSVGKDKDGQDVADPEGKNSVSIDVVNATGTVDGKVVINDVAKASELGAVGELAANLKNPAGGPTTVVQAVNKVNQKIDDSLKQVNGDITSAVTEAKKHTEVKSVDSDNNVTIDGTTTNAAGGTVYKLGLNKDNLNLGNVHIYGNEGIVTAKTVEAETIEIDDQTRLDKTGLTTGNTTVTNNRIIVGGDNGIKMEAKGDQQTISGLSNRIWTGKAVSGRAATEDQLQQAVENATATAAQNEQHIQSGNYDVGQGKGLDGKPIGKNSVAINVISGDGTKPGDVKGQVIIKDVAKASDLGDTTALDSDIQNKNGSTSVVDAVNNLNGKVGDNQYLDVTGKEIQNGDSSTTAIGKLNNRMNDIYSKATQHSTVTRADDNVTIQTSTNADGGTNYQIGLNKDEIHLGNVTLRGNDGAMEAKSMKADSFTAGDTVVNKDGVKVGDKSALTGDSLKVGGKTYVDDKGINANGKAIGNVGDGKNDGDAVNVKQVNDLAARQGEAIGQNAAHINQLDRAVNRLDSRINRVGAGAAALAALHPGEYNPDDKVDFAAGFGNYRGASAAAVGMYYHPDETTTMSVGASFGGGENMVNAGITWKMGKDSGHMRTQAATKAVPVQFVAAPTQTQQSSGQAEGTKMPQPVTAVTTTASGQQVPIVAAYLPSVDSSTRAENDELKELLARQTAILEKLADQKTAPAQAAAPVSGEDLFPDVPENHWAYDFVAKLAQAGALKDCRVEDPANNPMLTRNDFAQILYTALKNGATKNPALNKDNGLNRLASEFRAELKNVKR